MEWSNSELHEYNSFNFLFDKFKDFYLREIFPDFKKINIYEPDLGNVGELNRIKRWDRTSNFGFGFG